MVRASISCETVEEIATLLRLLLRDDKGVFGLEVLRLKNRFNNPTPGGFRDINVNIQVAVAVGGGIKVKHVCELQIHCKEIKEAAKMLSSHKVYEYFRTYFRGSVEAVDSNLRLLEIVVQELEDESGDLVAVVDRLLDQEMFTKLDSLMNLLTNVAEYDLAVIIRQRMLAQCPSTPAYVDKKFQLMGELSTLLHRQGKIKEAVAMQRAVVGQTIHHHGNDHPKSFVAMTELCIMLQTNGDHKEAFDWGTKAVEGLGRTVGTNDMATLSAMSSLASVCNRKGDYLRAKALYSSVCSAYDTMFGATHPNTLQAKSQLANVLGTLGDFTDTIALHEASVNSVEKSFGLDHPLTLDHLHDLGVAYMDTNDFQRSSDVLKRCLDARLRVQGQDHHDSLDTMDSYGNAQKELAFEAMTGGDEAAKTRYLNEAAKWHEKSLMGRRGLFGDQDSRTAQAMSNLAGDYRVMDRVTEAESLYRSALACQEAALQGDENEHTWNMMFGYATVLAMQGRCVEGEYIHLY